MARSVLCLSHPTSSDPHAGSFIEYLPILLAQREKYASAPDTLPYHLIAPSLIGYGFSSPPPINKDFVPADNSRLLHKMMLGLGFGQSGYIIQGGDVGSFLAEASFSTYDEVKGQCSMYSNKSRVVNIHIY